MQIYTGCYDGSVQAVKLNLMKNYRCWVRVCLQKEELKHQLKILSLLPSSSLKSHLAAVINSCSLGRCLMGFKTNYCTIGLC